MVVELDVVKIDHVSDILVDLCVTSERIEVGVKVRALGRVCDDLARKKLSEFSREADEPLRP